MCVCVSGNAHGETKVKLAYKNVGWRHCKTVTLFAHILSVACVYDLISLLSVTIFTSGNKVGFSCLTEVGDGSPPLLYALFEVPGQGWMHVEMCLSGDLVFAVFSQKQ